MIAKHNIMKDILCSLINVEIVYFIIKCKLLRWEMVVQYVLLLREKVPVVLQRIDDAFSYTSCVNILLWSIKCHVQSLSNSKTIIINRNFIKFSIFTGTWTYYLEISENKQNRCFIRFTYVCYENKPTVFRRSSRPTNLSCLNRCNYTLAIRTTMIPSTSTDLVDLLGVVLSSFFPESTEGTTKSFSLEIFSLPVHWDEDTADGSFAYSPSMILGLE